MNWLTVLRSRRDSDGSGCQPLNGEGLVYMLTHAITNFTGFAPLGVVLVAMFGIGLLEDSGLIGGALKSAVEVTPAKLITPMIVFLGVMSTW